MNEQIIKFSNQNCNIQEALVFNKKLSDSERHEVENNLSEKWGIVKQRRMKKQRTHKILLLLFIVGVISYIDIELGLTIGSLLFGIIYIATRDIYLISKKI